MILKKYFLLFPILFLFQFESRCQKLLVDSIVLTGNNKTHNEIILRELLFKQGDSVSVNDLGNLILKSKQNLLNTSLFNFVTITYEQTLDNSIIINILLEERWYLWPYPILEHADRNFSSWLYNKNYNMINYGFYFVKYNFRGRREVLKIKTRLGYKEQYSIYYSKSNFDAEQKHGVALNFSYFRQKEVAFQTNLNRLVYINNDEDYLKKSINTDFIYSYRPRFYSKHLFEFTYDMYNISDTLLKLNPDYIYNGSDFINAIGFSYNYNYDNRNSTIYPTKGIFFNIGTACFKSVSADYYKCSVTGNEKYYSTLIENLFLSQSMFFKIIQEKDKMYLLADGLGYENFIRGYELYVINAQDYLINKLSFNYAVVPMVIKTLNFVPSKKINKIHFSIFTNVFFDCGYAYNVKYGNNNLENQFLYSAGVGIDLVTYYDKVFRIESTLNKQNEFGIFLHFGAPI